MTIHLDKTSTINGGSLQDSTGGEQMELLEHLIHKEQSQNRAQEECVDPLEHVVH